MKRCTALVLVLLLAAAPAYAAALPVTRGAFVAALWEADGAIPSAVPTEFSDVGQNDLWTEGVGWAAARNLVRGTGNRRFEPERPITREEAATILRRYFAIQGRDTFLPDGAAECNDYADISPWADDSLYWACDVGLLDWSEAGRLAPQETISPADLPQILSRATYQ